MKEGKEDFGRIVGAAQHRQPEVYERDTAGVLVARDRRDAGPVEAMTPLRFKNGRVVPPKRIIEILRREHDGKQIEVQVVVTTLRDMYRKGTIGQQEYDEGVEFKHNFDIGKLSGMRIPSLDRLGGGGSRQVSEPAGMLDAKDYVFECLKMIGGADTALGRALWNIVGMEYSIREMERSDGNPQAFWQAMLRAALELLVAKRRRARKHR